ncbi:IucA/IucC family protein [Streptomyces fructofermentans]|uniref:IucA/IucC family protein n=1 Tax=Streptomyces fructofermentans TaxID=152141 RepID=UPI0033D5F815
MTAPTATDDTFPADRTEADLVIRVLGALLREDVVGLRSAGTPTEGQDGAWLRRTAGNGRSLLVPVTADGFQCEYAARLPLIRAESDNGTSVIHGTCDAILTELRALAEPADREGFDAFAVECRQTLGTMRLHAATRGQVMGKLTDRHGHDLAAWQGAAGALAFDTLAARLDHPVYPTARGRSGLGDTQLRSYAPEFHSRFALRWLAVPRDAVTGEFPHAWPTPARLGLDGLDRTHVVMPVHPLTVGADLEDALGEKGLTDRVAVPVGTSGAEAVPTLSMRTVALTCDPTLHVKLPLPTATLGLRNRRTIKPGTLVDGAAGQRLIERIVAREPRLRDTVLHADETVHAHAGHELLAVLFRRLPAGLDDCLVVPMAALLAEAPDGRLVFDHLADLFHDGDTAALLDACLTPLFDWQTTLFGYGVALESHQQNISLVLDRYADGRPRVRLLLKDNDGPRVNTVRLRERLGNDAPESLGFDDPRTFGTSDGPVADLFTTITLHLCAGALAFGLARHGRAPLPKLLRLVRDLLAEAVERLGTEPGGPGDVLRTRVLEAPRLPVKAMVTAGTLLSKERSGAADINKHYTSGPNYLLRQGRSV